MAAYQIRIRNTEGELVFSCVEECKSYKEAAQLADDCNHQAGYSVEITLLQN